MLQYNSERKLLKMLSSGKRSLQIQAIITLSKNSNSQESLDVLKKFMQTAEREAAFFAAQAVSRIETRLSSRSERPDTLREISRDALLNPNPAEIEDILLKIRNNPEAISDELWPAVAAFLEKHGVSRDAKLLCAKLPACDSNLVLPFIGALEALDISFLRKILPDFLASSNPLVRSHAILTLLKIDPEEAEKHLSELLASRQAEERHAGVSIAFFFKFSNVREYIFALLQDERNPEVQDALQTFLASNPELETALRLLDMIAVTPGEESTHMRRIFKHVCVALKAGGLLFPDQAEPKAVVALWRERKLAEFLDELEIQMAVADEAKLKSIVGWLESHKSIRKVAEFISRMALNPVHEEILKKFSERPNPNTAQIEPQLTSDEILTKLKTMKSAEKFKHLESINAVNLVIHLKWLKYELEHGSEDLKSRIFLMISRLLSNDFKSESTNQIFNDATDKVMLVNIAKKNLNSPDPILQLGAISFLEKAAPEELIPFMPKFLISPDPRVSIKAVRIAVTYDEESAFEALTQLLRSVKPSLRANAVSCLMLFNPEKVISLLLDRLEQETHSTIARRMILVLLSNPSTSSLERLDKIKHSASPAVSVMIAQARIDMYNLLVKLDMIVPEQLKSGDTAESELHEGEGRQKRSVNAGNICKPYDVSTVRTILRRRNLEKAQENAPLQAISQETLNRMKIWALVSLSSIILVILPIHLFKKSDVPRDKALQPAVKTSQSVETDNSQIVLGQTAASSTDELLGKICRFKVNVEKIDGRLLYFTGGGKNYRVRFQFDVDKSLAGTIVEFDCIPYRVIQDGTILAEGHSLVSRPDLPKEK